MMTHISYKQNRYNVCKSYNTFNTSLKGLAFIELNVTEKCTRKCSFCPRYSADIYPNKDLHMSLETANIFIDKILQENFKGDIYICGFSEPLLNPQIIDIINAFKMRTSNYICLITNGDVLSVYAQQLKILDCLSVSCYDGPQQITKIKNILESVQFANYNIRDLYFNSINVEEFAVSHNFNNRGGILSIQEKQINRSCFLPFYQFIVDYDGEVVLCPQDWHRKTKNIGNIKYNTLQEIWNSCQLINIRKNLKKHTRIDTPCSACSVDGMCIGKDSFNCF